jgi:hypothetical protein
VDKIASKIAGFRPNIHLAAEDCLLAYISDPESLLEVLNAVLTNGVRSADWRYRKSGLKVISTVVNQFRDRCRELPELRDVALLIADLEDDKTPLVAMAAKETLDLIQTITNITIEPQNAFKSRDPPQARPRSPDPP